MPKLIFKVSSDYQEVIRLRQECEKLETQLKKMDVNKSPAAAKALETQLVSTRQQMMGLVTEAAKAGAVMERDFKNGIYNASQTVNDFTQKIIDQKRVVKDVEHDVKRLGDAYKTALKRNPTGAAGLLSEYQSAKKTLDEERATLFGLTQQQAEARLSVKRLKDEYAAFKEEAGETVEANEKMSVSLTKVLGVIGGVTALKNFATELVNVRGQFQQLEIAFSTMLKSKEKADKLMSELVDIAANTSFDLQGVASSAKQMIAYGSSAENVGDELVMLGNVAAGVGSQLSEIAYLYGTLRTQGRAYAVDIRQFAGRGIPIYEELAKVLGVTKDKVSELVKEGKVGFKEVEQAFKNMTSESGIYYNLMEEQSKSLTGQLSNLGDAWDSMLNEIGKNTQGIASSGISALKGLIENYETVGKVLLGLIATYGTYKTATLALWVIEQARAKTLLTSVASTKALTAAQTALNVVMKANPYVLVATTLAGVVSAMWAFHDSATESEKAQDRLNKRQEEARKIVEEHKIKIDKLIESSRDMSLSDLQRGQSLADLRQEYPKIFAQYDIESIKLADILKLKQQIAEEEAKRAGEKKKQDFENLESEITYYENLLKSMSGQQGVDGYVKKLKELRAERDILLKEKGKGISEQFISSLKEIDISEFDRYISELEKRIKGKGENAKVKMRLPIDVKGSLSDEALFEVKDIKTLIDTAKSTRQSRIEAPQRQTTYQDDLAKAKLDWETAKKGYESLIKDQNATTEQVKKAREEMEAKEKAYKELGGTTEIKSTDKDKQKQEQEKLYDQLLQLRFKNQQDEINLIKEGAEKKRKQIELDYQKEYAEIQKLEKEWGAKNGGKLTQEQSIEISRRYTNAEEKKDKSLYDIEIDSLKAEKYALNTYLQEYGTFQQRKYAIAQEYADKIAKAQTEAEKLKLSKDRDSKITAIDTEVLKSEIDWGTVFGEFGGMFSDMIKPALDDAKKYMQTDEFKNSDASSQQALVEAVNQMEKSLGGAGTLNFKKLGEDVKAYQDALLSLNDAKAQEIEAIEKLKKAQEEYENALKNGTESEKQSAKDALDTAQINANAASENVQAQTSIVNKNQRQVSDTSRKLKASMDNVIEGLQKISSGSLASIYSGLIQAGKGIGGAISKVSGSLESVPIIGWIVSIIDVFKDGLSVVVGGILDAVLNAVSGIIGDILSGDLFVTIGESLVKGLSNIFDALTWGGFSKWVKNGDSDKTLESDTERLVASNEDLKKSIDKLSEKMEDSSIAEANDIYDKQVANLKQSIANTRELMQRNTSAYSNGFWGIGGTKSSSHRVNKGTSEEDWRRITEIVGRDVDESYDFFSMSPEEMLKVFEQAPDLYSKIKSLADDGYKDAAQYMDEYIAYASEMEELSVALSEKLTSTTFDSVRDDFKSTLLDMESDAEDFTDNFEKMMQNAAIEALMGNFDSQLKSWYDDFAKAMGDDGQLSKSEQENLRRKYENLVNRGLAERDALMEAMGWDNEESTKEQQSASSRGFGSEMTHEDAGELSGRFTAVYESNLRIETATQQQTVAITELRGSISVLTGQVSGMYNIADETRTILANSYLELQQIRENTGEIIKPIKQMQSDIQEMKDTIKNRL